MQQGCALGQRLQWAARPPFPSRRQLKTSRGRGWRGWMLGKARARPPHLALEPLAPPDSIGARPLGAQLDLKGHLLASGEDVEAEHVIDAAAVEEVLLTVLVRGDEPRQGLTVNRANARRWRQTDRCSGGGVPRLLEK